MADNLAASKLVGYAAQKASGRNALGAGKLAAYGVEKASGRNAVGSGKLVAYTVLSDGAVLGWPHGDDLGLRAGAALAAATSLTSTPAFTFSVTADLSTGAAPDTADNTLALIPVVL